MKSRVNWFLIRKPSHQELSFLLIMFIQRVSNSVYILMLGRLIFMSLFLVCYKLDEIIWYGLIFYIFPSFSVFTCQVRPGSLSHEVDDADIFASWVSFQPMSFKLWVVNELFKWIMLRYCILNYKQDHSVFDTCCLVGIIVLVSDW